MKIIFMGTPKFGAVILEKLCQADMKPILVVTSPDKPVGRKQIMTPPPTKLLAESYKIPVIQPDKILDSRFPALPAPDLIVVAAYGQVLPQEILDIPKHGCLNIHPSLLPKYRGATPVQSAILSGDKETGVSIILMDSELDHGPILAQRKTEIGSNETAKQLNDRLAVLGAELLIDVIPDWLAGRIQLQEQDEKKATYTKILTKRDGQIDWKRPAEEIERQIRAFSPWPGAYTFGETKKEKRKILLKILGTAIENNELIIKRVQPEGKKPMSYEDFLRGNRGFKIIR